MDEKTLVTALTLLAQQRKRDLESLLEAIDTVTRLLPTDDILYKGEGLGLKEEHKMYLNHTSDILRLYRTAKAVRRSLT